MKMRISEMLATSSQIQPQQATLAVLAVIALCLLPTTARAAGIADILTLLQTITSTLQGAIGGALSEIQT